MSTLADTTARRGRNFVLAARRVAMLAARIGRAAMLLWGRPIWAGVATLAVYAAVAQRHVPIWRATDAAYYNYLADAFLHGQLSLRLLPPETLDLSLFHGHYYLYFGPFPSVLLMPFVALFGVGVSDVLCTIVLGAVNVGLVAQILRLARAHGVIDLGDVPSAILVLFFAFGTVQFTVAPYGLVWELAQVAAFTFVALAYVAALSLSGRTALVATGCALAAALLTRNSVVFAGIWPAWYLLSRAGWRPARRTVVSLAVLGAPLAFATAILGWYDLARFGNLLDNGIAYHLMAARFWPDFQKYGYFNLHYVPINLYYQYLFYPFPRRPESLEGGSLFLMSPVFFLAVVGVWLRRSDWSTWALVGSIMLVNVPILLLMGTGWKQYGPRYTLDFTVPLFLLTAVGARRVPTWVLVALTACSIGQYGLSAFLT